MAAEAIASSLPKAASARWVQLLLDTKHNELDRRAILCSLQRMVAGADEPKRTTESALAACCVLTFCGKEFLEMVVLSPMFDDVVRMLTEATGKSADSVFTMKAVENVLQYVRGEACRICAHFEKRSQGKPYYRALLRIAGCMAVKDEILSSASDALGYVCRHYETPLGWDLWPSGEEAWKAINLLVYILRSQTWSDDLSRLYDAAATFMATSDTKCSFAIRGMMEEWVSACEILNLEHLEPHVLTKIAAQLRRGF